MSLKEKLITRNSRHFFDPKNKYYFAVYIWVDDSNTIDFGKSKRIDTSIIYTFAYK